MYGDNYKFSVIICMSILGIITTIINNKTVPRKAIERLDLLLLALETIDLNGSESMFSLSNQLELNKILPNKVSIWKLRCKNPMRKNFNNNNMQNDEFDALVKLTTEMSKYLYPYIRAILSSKDNYKLKPEAWNDFQSRYIELINERLNIESIKVQKLIDINLSQNLYRKILLNLALCTSKNGYSRLKLILFNL